MAIKYICDKCGKEVTGKELTQVTIENKDLSLDGEDRHKIEFDVCAECFLKIQDVGSNKNKFPVLDTNKIDLKEEILKVREESNEFVEACKLYTERNIKEGPVVEEAFDTIQTIVNALDRLGLITEFRSGLEKHKVKMNDRGWKVKYHI